MAFFTFMAVWSYWEARERKQRRWLVLTGILIGFTLATKGQAVILPFTLIVWDVLRTWLNDDIGRLRILKPLFLVGFLLLVLVAPVLWLGYQMIPSDLMVLAFESSWGFVVTVVGSYLFVLLICLALAWPFGQSIGLLKDTLKYIRRVRVTDVVSVKNHRYVTYQVVDLLILTTVALFAFVLLFPNVWGAPIGGIVEWFAHYASGSAGLRTTYFVTRTIYLPLYYYPAIILIKTSILFLVVSGAGLVIGCALAKEP